MSEFLLRYEEGLGIKVISNKRKTVNERLGDIIGSLIERLACLSFEIAWDLFIVNKLSYMRIDDYRNVRSLKL